MANEQNVRAVLQTLRKRFSNPGAMEIGDPYRTLVAVILSARTRDEQVLKLLPGFFKAFPTVEKLARATPKQIEAKINTIGMYRQKARNINAMAKTVVGEYGGKIPKTMDELVTLAGVGRKTASVVLVACFEQPAIAVDTHVHRVTNRLGWVNTKTPAKTEDALLKIVPRDVQWIVNRVFVKFGRYICIPGRPRCWMCPIRASCQYPKKNLTEPKDADAIRADVERREKVLERLREEV
jgi:endonuclease-3